MRPAVEHFDVVVVGAGLSGIGAGVHLKQRSPDRTYVILEGRDASGGTWDLFRYPGIRSDSDMYTLGYSFKPWTQAKAIADGPSILKYVRETAAEHGVEQHIRYGHKVKRAAWSTPDARWTVEAEKANGEIATFTCSFLFMCAGYYSYDDPHQPQFEGLANFKGRHFHAQLWPKDLDYKGKRVVVIGSGATAVTIVPEVAKDAAHVTMLQRSPTYMVSRPAEDKFANWLRTWMPAKLAYGLIRWRNVLFQMYFFGQTRKHPQKAKETLIGMVRDELGPDYDVATHFTPKYNPWDQRLCLVPDADIFNAIKEKRASVVTDEIVRFTQDGIVLRSGEELPADIVVSATGLKLNLIGDVKLTVDGAPVDASKSLSYKGMFFSDIPNLASTFGYTNASWTLKADLTCEYVCRTLNHMRDTGTTICVPKRDPSVGEEAWLPLTSGYIERAREVLPKNGDRKPWKLNQNYALDLMALRFGQVDDGTMVFSNPPAKLATSPLKEAA
jgi:cation diffusion facilitator CzcD-associated flavoprotein CzcO